MPIYLTAAAVGVTICGIGVGGCLNGAGTQAIVQGRDWSHGRSSPVPVLGEPLTIPSRLCELIKCPFPTRKINIMGSLSENKYFILYIFFILDQ